MRTTHWLIIIVFVAIGLTGGIAFAVWQTNQGVTAERSSPEDLTPAQVTTPSTGPLSLEEENATETTADTEQVTACTDRPIRIKAVGDIMLSRTVGTISRRQNDPTLPFRETADYLQDADITFGNLESPFSDQGPPIGDSGMVFKAEPEMIEGIKLSGIDLLSLASNHFGDQGRYGMSYTFDHLTNHGIDFFGAGHNTQSALEVKVMLVENCRIGFLGYNDIAPPSYQATDDTPGHTWADRESIEQSVKEAVEKTDFLIVSYHWGVEYTPTPSQRQRELARAAIEAGADMIVSHHPHVVQEIEYIDNRLVIYSLGNFVFDQMWSVETQQGVIADFVLALPESDDPTMENNDTVNPELSTPLEPKRLQLHAIAFVPVRIHNYHQPRLITDRAEHDTILSRMGL